MSTSNYSTSSVSGPELFSLATVYWKTPKRSSQRRVAWISITSFLRWKNFDAQDVVPENLYAFQGHGCLALERLPANAQWKDVVVAVYPVNTKKDYGVAVPGNLSGSGGSSSMRKKAHVVLVSKSEDERDAWMNAIRIRISPWQLLYHRMKDTLIDSTLTPEDLRAMFACVEERSKTGLPDSTGDPTRIAENVERFGPAMEGLNVLSGFVETVATIVKKSAPLVKDTAENVADVAKCVTIVSSAFQVVALCASLAEMGLETKRGYEEWPRILALVEELRRATIDSMVPVLHPDGRVKEMLVKNMFQVQEELVDMLTMVEQEAMRSGTFQSVVRFFKSGELKTAEETVVKMKNCVLGVVQSGEIARHSVALENIWKRIDRGQAKNVSSLRLRPRLSPYFLGREKELEKLKCILDEYGSAAIMQYGGVGKTQLMVAFAERSEKRGWVPGGCHWIRGHGNRARFVESLANFTESMTNHRLSEEDRKDLCVILGSLKRKFNSFAERWMLCIDNADSNDVNEAVGELCSLARECYSKGWVLVTSRQGRRTLWRGMSSEQKLKLHTLGLNQAMAVLLRWKEEMLDASISDDVIAQKLEEIKRNEPLEYQALRKLAGDDKECGLGGLALALTQAGSFIHRRGISFSKYASLYAKKRHCEDVLRLFPEIEDRGLEGKHQRMIWATWKTNVDALSEKARCVLFAFAMFDCVSVPEEMVKGLDSSFISDELTYAEIINDELIDGASFLQKNKAGEQVTFETHRLIREFILLEIKSDLDRCRDALRRSAKIANENMESTSKSVRCERFRKLLPHLSSLLLFVSDVHFSLGLSIPTPSLFFKLFHSTVHALNDLGRTVDATPLCAGWLRILRDVYGLERMNRDVMEGLMLAGTISMENGAHAEAEKLFLEYLNISQQLHGERTDHSDFSNLFHKLGELAQKEGKLNVARSWYMKSLVMMFRMYGSSVDHEDIVKTMRKLGSIHSEQGSIEEAEKWTRRGLNMLRRLHGEDVDNTLISCSLNTLGLICKKKGDLNEAERRVRLSLEMERRVYGEEVDTLGISNRLLNLGSIASDRGDYEQAGNWYHQSYEMTLRIFGEGMDHGKIAKILYDMAKNDYKQGAVQEGVRKLKDCVEMERRIFGNDWPGAMEHEAEFKTWETKS